MGEPRRVMTKASLQLQSLKPVEVIVDPGRRKKQQAQDNGNDSPATSNVNIRGSHKEPKTVNLKNTKYEIMKFAMSSYKAQKKEDAKVALALRLGAIPPKNKCVNYKEFKAEKFKEIEENKNAEKLQIMGKVLKKSGRSKLPTSKSRGGGDILKRYGKVSKGLGAKSSKVKQGRTRKT